MTKHVKHAFAVEVWVDPDDFPRGPHKNDVIDCVLMAIAYGRPFPTHGTTVEPLAVHDEITARMVER